MRERLISWGMSIEHDCELCNQAEESHKHYLYGCEYAKIWTTVMDRCYTSRKPFPVVKGATMGSQLTTGLHSVQPSFDWDLKKRFIWFGFREMQGSFIAKLSSTH